MGTERAWDNPESMVGVDDALARILARISPLAEVELSVGDALGLVAARDVVSRADVPPFQNSAMDGYAVRSADTAGAPVTLRVVEMVAAGGVAHRAVHAGEAIRIMTGAPLPAGADSVIRFEETTELGSAIALSRPVTAGENVRAAGEDVRPGDIVVPAGTVLGAASIGALASIGEAHVAVYRRPRVAILSTGDELADPSEALVEGQIRDSNGPMLAALVRQVGGEPVSLGVARDRIDDLRARLAESSELDLVVTSGGVSVGDFDVVKDVLSGDGAIDIWQVRMKPGKPLAFGLLRGTPLLGLPGNPSAAFVSFLQFGRPAIRRMLGHDAVELPTVDATLRERIVNRGRRRHFVRGVIKRTPHGLEVRPTGGHGSGQLMPLVRSNCLIVVPEASEAIEVGEVVRVQILEEAGFDIPTQGGISG